MSVTVSRSVSAPVGLVPTGMDQAVRLADMMAKGRLVPSHFHNQPGDCLMVIEQAMRWGMSPFAVAQSTSVIQGKLMFEGKLVAAAIQSSGILDGRLTFDYSGEGDARTITVGGMMRGETKPRTIEVRLKDARTSNKLWTAQPDQQLAYHGSRVWGRRHAPEVMLGVYSPEEMSAPTVEEHAGPTITVQAEPQVPEPPRMTIRSFLDALEIDLRNAPDASAVAKIQARLDVQRALDSFVNGASERLNHMLDAALERHAVPDTGAAAEAVYDGCSE